MSTRVVLHRIGRDAQGPIDSTLSNIHGRFWLSFHPDSGAFYILSARYAGIEYFSQPVPTDRERPDSAIPILVYDTSSTAPVSLEARHLVITRPGEDGARSVLDIMVLRNDSRVTRVASDTLRPTWSAPLPAGSMGLELNESDFSADAVARRGDTVAVVAPFAPGEKQLTVQYLLPSGRRAFAVPITEPGVKINVLAEEPDVGVNGQGIEFADSQMLQGRSFRRWTGVVPQGSVIRVTLPVRNANSTVVLAALVGTMTLALVLAAWRLVPRPSGSLRVSPAELLDTMAALDVRYAGREADTPPEEWQSYQQERAKLKARIEASLAAGGKSS
ncbi:MAG TPA: hypothetical protein VFH40_16835 [Gemmatimonadales bacterium]|nr:hypothetical protein [Gemmatimonadales bacterium]